MTRAWLTSPYGALVVLSVGYLWLRTILAVSDVRALIRWRRSRPKRSARTPAAMIPRQSQRTTPQPRGPHMPSEDEITRYGRGDYGPRIEQPGPVRTRPDRHGLVAGGLAFLATALVAGLIAGAYYLGHRSTGSPKPARATNAAATPSSTPSTTPIVGKITMPRYSKDHISGEPANWKAQPPNGCEGIGGYDDMTLGASVTVYDASGTVIGTSTLLPGIRHGSTCEWDFSVSDLPIGQFYQVEVSHRGKVTVQYQDRADVALTLGD